MSERSISDGRIVHLGSMPDKPRQLSFLRIRKGNSARVSSHSNIVAI